MRPRRASTDNTLVTRRNIIAAVLTGVTLGLVASVWSIAGHTTQLHDSSLALADRRPLGRSRQLQELQTELARSLAAEEQLTRERDAALQQLRALQEGQGRLGGPDVECSGGVDRHAPWGPGPVDKVSDPKQRELAELLAKVAINNEVLVAISNGNYATPGGMLDTWMESVKRAGVKNAMVLALDTVTWVAAEDAGMPVFQMKVEIPESQRNVGDNHAVSSLKFRILRSFLHLGYAVLLSDVDIVTLSNPFRHLYRDCDVESMSDGWDNGTAYGYNDVADDPAMGWARYAHSMRVFVFNSGLFYLRPTAAAMELLDRVVHRLETENGWDQAIFNEVIFFPSRPGFRDPSVTRRVMDYMLFMNSKVLFRFVRNDPRLADHRPVMVHVNYHPDKHQRMLAIVQRYVHGDRGALAGFPEGSG